jgi:hypothetical protein
MHAVSMPHILVKKKSGERGRGRERQLKFFPHDWYFCMTYYTPFFQKPVDNT